MRYNFDEIIDRRGTVCEKYDAVKNVFNEDVLPLWIADTDFKTPDFIISALKARLEHEILGYSFRCKYYYEVVRSWLHRRNNWCVETEWLDFTPGVVCGLTLGINMFSNEGDKIVIQPPVYPPFARVIRNNNRVVVNNPLVETENGYDIDFADLDKKLVGAKLFILCNPQNPTGKVYSADELKKIGELCLKHGVYIMSDEIHSDIILDPTLKHTHIASISKEIADICLTFIAPSKTFNIAGLSTSVAIIPNKELHDRFLGHMNRIHIDQGNIFGAVALRAAYSLGDEWLDQCNEYLSANADYVIDFIKNNTPKIKCIKPNATFLLWIDLRGLGMTHSQICEFLCKEAKLGLNSGIDFGAEGNGFMRLNIGTQKSVLQEAMKRLKDAYDRVI